MENQTYEITKEVSKQGVINEVKETITVSDINSLPKVGSVFQHTKIPHTFFKVIKVELIKEK
jgi:hypothetical protein